MGSILNPLVGVMDTTPRRLSLCEGHFQGPQGQFRVNPARESISEGLTRVHVQNNSQIDKGRQDSNIGDIGKPNLINGSGHQIANQVGKDRIWVIALSSLYPSSSGTAEKIVLPHHPKHPLVIVMAPTKLRRACYPT